MRAILTALTAALLVLGVLTAAAAAQDGNTRQENSQTQSVTVNQVCEAGAVCNQSAEIGGQAPPAQIQASAPEEAAPEETARPAVYRGREWWQLWGLFSMLAVMLLGIFAWGMIVRAEW